MTLSDDEALFEAVWKALKPERLDRVRVAIVDNTLHLTELWVSTNLLKELKEDVEVIGKPFSLAFNNEGEMRLEP